VEGALLIQEAEAAGWAVESEFVTSGNDPVSKAPCFELAEGVIDRVATTERPQPNLAVVGMPERDAVLDVARFAVAADRLNDPGNLGTVLRSAEAAGVDLVALTPGSVDPYNPKVVRASAGAIFHVPVATVSLADLARAGMRLIGTSSHRGVPHTTVDWSGRIAVVLGSEAHGLPDDAPIDAWARIEHRGRSESLNVAMAATVLVFEAARSR
jgi:TrmH family RNA methyltransferase